MTVTFCGHGSINYDEIIKQKLYEILENLILQGASEFYLGGYGNFDILASQTLKELKNKYQNINLVLVIPYLNHKYDMALYDVSVYPPIENTPPRFAISKRNEWMVNNSDFVVSYVEYGWGGAAKTFNFANKKHKHIINLYESFSLSSRLY